MRNQYWLALAWVGGIWILWLYGYFELSQEQSQTSSWFPVTNVATSLQSVAATEAVFLCQRRVDRWGVQLLAPGAEHYSIWLPAQDIHRGVSATWYGQPLYWVDEVFIHRDQPELFPNYLSCMAIPQANPVCVAREVYRQQDEGPFSLTNHCQHVVLDILEACGGVVPVIVPKQQPWPF